jgi:hypothetical protein
MYIFWLFPPQDQREVHRNSKLYSQVSFEEPKLETNSL